MQTIQTTIEVTADRVVTLNLPEDVEVGRHVVVLTVLDRHQIASQDEALLAFLNQASAQWRDCPAEDTLRRSKLYGEWER
ncbi:MAG: hypothetical protein IT204_12220 [Fimbriimonadaceae bacterium]|nr:hypothetical protein [Fimbriimonadaceae bacterium]